MGGGRRAITVLGLSRISLFRGSVAGADPAESVGRVIRVMREYSEQPLGGSPAPIDIGLGTKFYMSL